MQYTQQSYEKHIWTLLTPITAKWMNEVERQYDGAKAAVDSHDHDDEHYPRSEADATFFTTTFYTGFDADLLDGLHLSTLLGSALPKRAVIWWSGDGSDIPQGWAICTGQTYLGVATPDLRDRFLLGAEGNFSAHSKGGSATFTPIVSGLMTGLHLLTVEEIPEHFHSFTDAHNPPVSRRAFETTNRPRTNPAWAGDTSYTGGGQGHRHNCSMTFGPISTLPSFIALLLICKCF